MPHPYLTRALRASLDLTANSPSVDPAWPTPHDRKALATLAAVAAVDDVTILYSRRPGEDDSMWRRFSLVDSEAAAQEWVNEHAKDGWEYATQHRYTLTGQVRPGAPQPLTPAPTVPADPQAEGAVAIQQALDAVRHARDALAAMADAMEPDSVARGYVEDGAARLDTAAWTVDRVAQVITAEF